LVFKTCVDFPNNWVLKKYPWYLFETRVDFQIIMLKRKPLVFITCVEFPIIAWKKTPLVPIQNLCDFPISCKKQYWKPLCAFQYSLESNIWKLCDFRNLNSQQLMSHVCSFFFTSRCILFISIWEGGIWVSHALSMYIYIYVIYLFI
jgi:hypothetical protein